MRPNRSRLWLGLILLSGLALRLWGIGFASSTPIGRPDEEIFGVEALAMFVRPCNRLATGWPDGFFLFWHAVLRLERAWYHLRHDAGTVNLGCLLAIRPLAVLLPVRVLSALLGTITAWLVGRIAAAVVPERAAPAALWATAIYAFNYLVGRDGHFGVSDALLCFEVAITLLFCLRAVDEPWWIVWATFVAGAAFSTKYSGVGLVVPCIVAGIWIVVRLRERAAAPIACAMAAALAGVLFFSPHILTHWADFRAGMLGHAVRYGSAEPQSSPMGFIFYPAIVFPATFGWPGWILCLAGIVWCARRRKGLVLTAYALVFFMLVLGPLSRVFLRYGSPLVPALAAAGGLAAVRMTDWLSGRMPRWLAGAALALLTLAIPAARLVAFDRLLARSDTRDLARDWILEHGPEKVILSEGSYAHVQAVDKNLATVCRQELPADLWQAIPILTAPSKPLLDDPKQRLWPGMIRWREPRVANQPPPVGSGERGWENIAFLGTARYLAWENDQRWGLPDLHAIAAPDYLVQGRGPFALGQLSGYDFWGPRDPACWVPTAHFSPGDLDAANWDLYDALFVPFTRFGTLERPGPELFIYANGCKGHPRPEGSPQEPHR